MYVVFRGVPRPAARPCLAGRPVSQRNPDLAPSGPSSRRRKHLRRADSEESTRLSAVFLRECARGRGYATGRSSGSAGVAAGVSRSEPGASNAAA